MKHAPVIASILEECSTCGFKPVFALIALIAVLVVAAPVLALELAGAL